LYSPRFFSGSGGSSVASGAKASLEKIFDSYREDVVHAKNSVGVNGTMSYLEAIGVDTEGLDFLVVSEIIQSPAMGEMERDGFVNGWVALK
jgi:hypothetical protein